MYIECIIDNLLIQVLVLTCISYM